MSKKCFFIDWLSVYCHSTYDFTQVTHPLFLDYIFELQKFHSRQFSHIWYVLDASKQKIFEIESMPCSEIMHSRACIIKVANETLYTYDAVNLLLEFMKAYGFVYKSLSRIDICCDLIRFDNQCTPQRLINRFLSTEWRHLHAKTYTLVGNNGNHLDHEYIRWGSRSSGLCVYMYNKSKEMRDKSPKKWITDSWAVNGLDYTKSDIWRIEFSIKGDAQYLTDRSEVVVERFGDNLISKRSGEVIFRLHADYFLQREFVRETFLTYAKKYFVFVVSATDSNITRMTKVKLFDEDKSVTLLPAARISQSLFTLSDRMAVKRLFTIITSSSNTEAKNNAICGLKALLCQYENTQYRTELIRYYHKLRKEVMPEDASGESYNKLRKELQKEFIDAGLFTMSELMNALADA